MNDKHKHTHTSSSTLITLQCTNGVSTVVENLSYAVDDERYIAGYFGIADVPCFQPGDELEHCVLKYGNCRLEMNKVKINSIQVEILSLDLELALPPLHVYGFQGFFLEAGAQDIKEST